MERKPQEQLKKEIEEAKTKVEVGAKYFHYKHPDQFYKVLLIAIIEATETVSLIYQAEYGEKLIWVRPLSEFLSTATTPDGKEVARFTKVS